MVLSALADQDIDPTAAGVEQVLGASYELWEHLLARMEASYGPVSTDWSFGGAKYGWICRLKRKKRVILRLTPQEGSFLVGVLLGDRALGLLRRDQLSSGTNEIIDQAPRYGEGTGFLLPVSTAADCDEVEVVIEAKMA